MGKKLLNSREEIEVLVRTFYVKVKADDLLGPIFNNAENFSWEIHIPIMINFWENIILDTGSYRGNTLQVHLDLHRRHPLTKEHFDRWKLLFYSTLDELFEGKEVDLVHRRVESISGMIQYKISGNPF